jgi:hypothetical protein
VIARAIELAVAFGVINVRNCSSGVVDPLYRLTAGAASNPPVPAQPGRRRHFAGDPAALLFFIRSLLNVGRPSPTRHRPILRSRRTDTADDRAARPAACALHGARMSGRCAEPP